MKPFEVFVKKVYQTDWIVEGIIQQIEVVKKAFDDVGITDDVKDTAWYAAVIKKPKIKRLSLVIPMGTLNRKKLLPERNF
jgi:hypothetical protein